ncbi:MAG: prepilin peptidase [Thermovenabulum sp.]|uniref:prepilin peptidase n=1 Tax=Thermovenabulum sp. TaxID=3100335 RepID=UPI003C79944D
MIINTVFLLIAVLFDSRYRKIPNEISYTLFITNVAWVLAVNNISVKMIIEIIKWVFIIFILLNLIIKGYKMGGGDIKLILALTPYLKSKTIILCFFILTIALAKTILFAVKEEGIKTTFERIKTEILGLEIYKALDKKYTHNNGALIIFVSFLLTKII